MFTHRIDAARRAGARQSVRLTDAGPSADALLAYLDGLLAYDGGVMFVRSADDGRFLLVNGAFEGLVDRPAAEIVGRTGHDLFPTDIADAHTAQDRLIVGDGTARTSHELVVDGSGRRREYIAHKFPLTDETGRIFAVGGIAMEITSIEAERRSSREARMESEVRFRAVFDHAPIGQIFSNMDGLVTSVNVPMAAMLGYLPHEMVGQAIGTFASPAEYERIRATADSLLSDEALSTSDIRRFWHRSGHEVPVRVTSALLRDDSDEPRWWVSMVIDISDEERTGAELVQAHEAAVRSSERLRLLHSIATAANEASTLDKLAPHVLETVCQHLGWAAGALVHWPPDAPTAQVIDSHGLPCLAALAASIPEPTSDAVTVADHSCAEIVDAAVLVPLTGNRDGRLAWLFLANSTDLGSDQCEMLSLVGIETTRVIERESAARMQRESEERFRSVFDSSPLPMGLTLGTTGTFGAVNEALCELLGRSAEELIGATAQDICHPDDVHLTDPAGAAALAAPNGRHRFELRLMHSSGAVVIAMITLAWMNSADGGSHLLAQMEDITAQRTVEEVLRRQAEHDGLTGLANRTCLGRVLAEMAERTQSCAILFIDLDGFKLINDTRGHDVGDEVLLEVTERLRKAVRPSDLIARFGGDEFVVVCSTDSHEDSTARLVADRIEAALVDPIGTRSGPASVTASIGIAAGLVDVSAPQELVQRADAAMYHAKQLGKDRLEFYDVHLHQRAVEHQRTEAALRNALADDRFALHYQPIVDLSDSRIVGFEALVRLIDEAGTIVAPDKFITVAEQSGLIVPMGAWVLQESCRTISELRERTGRPLTMSVNIAARQAARPDLAETVLCALDRANLPEDALTLELTESALLEADESTLRQLTMLRDRGVVIGLDDFGTGYSSLTYLRRFPVSHLKVDRSFVAGMTSVSSDHAIVRAVTRLADDLGMYWIAEGVETNEQRDALVAMGAGFAQGYLWSRPVPVTVLPHLLGLGPVRRSA